MLVLGIRTLRGQVPLFETLRSLVDDICHGDVTERVNIVNKAPEYCAVHPKWADGQSAAKTGFRGLRSTETGSASKLWWPDQDGIEPTTQEVIFYRRLSTEDVVELERFVDLGKPFGPVGSAAAAPLIERQFQLAQQAGDLLARRHVAQARTGAKGCFVNVGERRQAP